MATAYAVSSCRLCFEQRTIGTRVQRLPVDFAQQRARASANARRHGHIVRHAPGAQFLQDGARFDQNIGGGNDCKFLTADSRDQRLRWDLLAERTGEDPQYLIPPVMADRFVDALEMIEVGDQQGLLAGPSDNFGQKGTAVEQSRQ